MSLAVLAALWLADATPDAAGFKTFQALCITTEADPAKVGPVAVALGLTPDPAHPGRFEHGGISLALSDATSAGLKELGDIKVHGCALTLPALSEADVAGLRGWMGHSSRVKEPLPFGAFVMLRTGAPPKEAAFNTPDTTRTALRTGRLRLVNASAVGGGLKLFYGVVEAETGGKNR